MANKHLPEYATFCNENPIFKLRMQGVDLDLAACTASTCPVRAEVDRLPVGPAKQQPYCGYETYDFGVHTWDTYDAYGRFRIRLDEMWESLRIVRAVRRTAGAHGRPARDGGGSADRLARAAHPRTGRPGQFQRAHPRPSPGKSMER